MSMEHLEKSTQETPGGELSGGVQSIDSFDARLEITHQKSDAETNTFDPDAKIDTDRQESPQTENGRVEISGGESERGSENEAFDPDARVDAKSEDQLDSKESKLYYDDNGRLYRIDDNLLPTIEYDKNGYHYKTDDRGRTISAEGLLRLRSPEFKRDMESMEIIGKGDQRMDDDRGHEIGYQFGGSGGIENVVAMDRTVNQKLYAPIENRMGDALRDGAKAYLRIESKYEGESFRPTGFKITTIVDGEKTVYNFKNESGGGKQ